MFNIRSHFSIGESTLSLDDIAELKLGDDPTQALVDTMTISGMPEYLKSMEGRAPGIIGCRIRIARTLEKSAETKSQRFYYPKVFVRTDEGLRRLMRLLSLANDDDHFYYVPRLLLSELLDAIDEDHFYVASGCFYSALLEKDAIDILKSLSDAVSASNCFIELCPVKSVLWDTLAVKAFKLKEQLALRGINLGLLVTRPVLYKEGEAESLDILRAISTNDKMNSPWVPKQYVRTFYNIEKFGLVCACNGQHKRLKGRGEHFDVTLYDEGLNNAKKIINGCQPLKTKWDVSLPKMAPNEYDELVIKVKEGYKRRLASGTFGYTPSDHKPYIDRLKYELSVLKSMDFSGYFLLVEDIVKWSKDNGILVGPGRGSVGGSLVAFLLGITDVDPLRFGLLFERFINPDRIDLPDADLDFMSTRRHEVIEYIVKKYGEDRVAGVSNYSLLGGPSGLRDVGRVYELPASELAVSKLVPRLHGQPVSLEEAASEVPQISTFKTKHPDVWKAALSLDGKLRSLGRHAAGIVVAGEPLVNRAVVERRAGEPTVNWDKRQVENMGLVKMDILGLSTLDIIQIALDQIKKIHGKTVDILNLPLDDEATLEAFAKGDTTGVFQFESGGMRKLLKDMGSKEGLTFEDIAAATALYRPGPMDSGLLYDFVAIKQGMMPIDYDHPNLEDALKETYGVITYQEQVMRVATDLAGFSFKEADHLRKAMGKKDPVKMASYKEQFVNGCDKHSGWDAANAEALWNKIEKFAGYAFNKSHAVEYSLISFTSMYLKVHYPTEFFAAALSVLDEDKRPALIGSALDKGIKVLPPDINISTNIFEVLNETTLCAPLNLVKGLSERSANKIVKAREDGPFESEDDLVSRVGGRFCNSRVRGHLDKVGAFARMIDGQPPADDPSRLRDQKELLPGLMYKMVKVHRSLDKSMESVLGKRMQEFLAKRTPEDAEMFCTPRMGKRAKFVAIQDGPSYSEDTVRKFAEGFSFNYIRNSLADTGFSMDDGYWTALCKQSKPMGEKFYPSDMIKDYIPLIEKELELLKPPVVVLLGSAAARHFVKEIKGPVIDYIGKVYFKPNYWEQKDKSGKVVDSWDCNFIVGFNPAMIHHDPEKQQLLTKVFDTVNDLI